jgi:enediyne polyketide synthase
MDGQGDHGGSVAIIGMACRFPGASDPAGFHCLTVAAQPRFGPVTGWPGGELHAALLDDWAAGPASLGDPGPAAPEDAGPVSKLAAEMTALALSDAGLREVAGSSRTGLVIASAVPELSGLVAGELGLAAYVPYAQAASLSSLHAVVAAAQAVASGDLDLAVAGGAELGLDPVWLALQARSGLLGTSQMRVYSADPAGLLPGDGCGVVVLARPADARAAGLPVYAEIAGWTAGPETEQAYRQAGVDPADIALIEGLGLGTADADLAELTAFTRLRRGAGTPAALGAVSAGLGYTRAAAGVASLIKTTLAMVAGTIPAGTGCARPHPLIEAGDARLRLPRQPEPWPEVTPGAGRTRLAAVGSPGTDEVPALHSLTGAREIAGVHLVLRCDHGTGGRAGRRRRHAADGADAPSPGGPAEPRNAPSDRGPAEPRNAPSDRGPAEPRNVPSDRGAVEPLVAPAIAEPPRSPGPLPGPGRRVTDVTWGSASHASVFALCGGDPGELAGRLEAIAASVEGLPQAELPEVARHLAFGVLAASDRGAPLRVALTAATPGQLADQARSAARLLRAGGPGAAAEPGVHVSAGAAGRVVVLFGGLAGSGLTYTALLATSLAAVRTLEVLGVRLDAGVGYSLGELSGLAWAQCLPAAEAARLAAQCDQVLRGCACHPAAMARIAADAETARSLCAPDRLHVAAYEGPRTHVLAGSPAGIRELTRRAAALGIAADVLPSLHALHCPAMARCTAPLRSVFAGTRFASPRRHLVSTVTGRLVMPGDDLADQLACQLSLPVLFTQALTVAAAEADLIVVAGPDIELAALAAGGCGVPAVAVTGAVPGPAAAAARNTPAAAVAALFTAGAITDLAPFMAAPAPVDLLARQTIPRMREAEPAGRHRDGASQENGARTTARSG